MECMAENARKVTLADLKTERKVLARKSVRNPEEKLGRRNGGALESVSMNPGPVS